MQQTTSDLGTCTIHFTDESEQAKLHELIDSYINQGFMCKEIIVSHLHPDHFGGETSLQEYLRYKFNLEVPISAQNNVGIEQFLEAIENTLSLHMRKIKLCLPYSRGELVSQLFELATVEHQEHTEDGVILTVQLPPSLQERFKEFQIKP